VAAASGYYDMDGGFSGIAMAGDRDAAFFAVVL
jgi:hypothetical protein